MRAERAIEGAVITEAPRLALPRDDFDRDVWCVLGLPIDRLTLAEAAVRVETSIRDRTRLNFVTPNVNILLRALRDARARRQIIDADLSLADGAPVVFLARLLGVPLPGRAAGSDLFEALRQRPGFPGRRMKVFFFGGRNGSAEAASRQVNSERGGLECVGWINPGFGDIASMSAPETLAAINRTAPDFLVVALGAAKGQDWIAENLARIEAPVIAHLGAVVDFTAGTVRRAPAFISRIGMEWAWRILAEPSLWRRYADDALGLVRAIATRLAPQLLARGGVGAPAAVATAPDGSGGLIIELSGDLRSSGLERVRASFREAVRSGTDVTLRFSPQASADRAFLGQLLMLEKALARSGRTLRACGMNRRLRTLFRANMMNYAEPGPAASAPAAAAAKAG